MSEWFWPAMAAAPLTCLFLMAFIRSDEFRESLIVPLVVALFIAMLGGFAWGMDRLFHLALGG